MLAGEIIDNRYQVKSLLGEGGMAAVYLAQDTQSADRIVAVKVIHGDFVSDSTILKRFEREVSVLKRINHPNVAALYDSGLHGDAPYFVMEYVPGCSLERFLNEGNQLNSIEVVVLLLGICDGLTAIHKQGVIHRDIKPGNIMVTPEGLVKIIDLGSAYENDSNLTKLRQRIGTLSYIAPEVWSGQPLTTSVDLYGLGVMLYELTTGKVPFESDNAIEAAKRQREHKPIAPINLVKNIPPWLNNLILRLLAKEVSDRPASTEIVAQFLVNHVVDEFDNLMANGLFGRPITTFARMVAGEKSKFPEPGTPLGVGQETGHKRTYIFQVKATEGSEAKRKKSQRGRALITIPLPKRTAAVFEIEKPSLDFLFMGIFLASLQVFDGVLTHLAVKRWSTEAEGNFLMRLLMQYFGPEITILTLKIFAIAAVYKLTMVAQHSKSIKNSLAVICIIYSCAAILPWLSIFFLRRA